MTRKKKQPGTLEWCICQAIRRGVSYGMYMAEHYEQDMWKEERRCGKKTLKS